MPVIHQLDEVVEAARRVVAAYPDNVNPVNNRGTQCVYTDLDDPDRHCIWGQVMVEMGLEAPGPEVMSGAYAVLRDMNYSDEEHQWTQDAIQFAMRLQRFADGPFDVDHDDATYYATPVAWGTIDVDRVLEFEEEV